MAGITMTSSKSMFDEMLGDINYNPKDVDMPSYPFMVRCGVPYRRPPRHPYFEWLLEMGRLDIDRVFKKESFEGREVLTFIFPERWMNVSEQRHLMWELKHHPEAETIQLVDIITHCPLIVGDFSKEMIRSLHWEDDALYEHERKVSFEM